MALEEEENRNDLRDAGISYAFVSSCLRIFFSGFSKESKNERTVLLEMQLISLLRQVCNLSSMQQVSSKAPLVKRSFRRKKNARVFAFQ